MQYEIKKLKKGNAIFLPMTAAEAVLIKEGSQVTTLDKAINRKIGIIDSDPKSGISIKRTGDIVNISHTNQITPNQTPQSLQIQYDESGHIVKSIPLGKVIITVNSENVIESNTVKDQTLNFGDDFIKDNNNNITIRWNNHGTI